MRKSFSKEKGEIYNYKDLLIGRINEKFENFKDLDYFGILLSFFGLGV